MAIKEAAKAAFIPLSNNGLEFNFLKILLNLNKAAAF
jgi:hypothetical protein